MNESISSGTTNKITLLPTLKELGYMEPGQTGKIFFIKVGDFTEAITMTYINRVYEVYFCQEDNKFIGEALIESFTKTS